jgi:DNA polymerase III subunit epsilon
MRRFAIVDIETTGGFAANNKITEIAVLIYDGEKIIERFETLINPERSIPTAITALTGISNAMVANAPKFFEVAKDIMLLLRDSVFVAHNVNFDYGFIREEFKSLGADFQKPKLCTVRMARKVFPGYPSYSLGNICARLGIPLRDRHRAMGDAEATQKLFETILRNDIEGWVIKALKKNAREGLLPPNLPADKFHSLPETTGVYYFHDQKGKIIYVGKAINIRKRIQSHFTGASKGLRFLESVFDLSYVETGSELVAMLLESDEIKKHWPLFNRSQKRSRPPAGLFIYEDQKGIIRWTLGRYVNGKEPDLAFNSLEEGRRVINELIGEFGLCPKCCGMQFMAGPCFHFQIKKCKGVCCGEETPKKYNKRVSKALQSLSAMGGDHILFDQGRKEDEKSMVLIENGKYLGFGYVDSDFTPDNLSEARQKIFAYTDNSDVRRILNSWLRNQSSD